MRLDRTTLATQSRTIFLKQVLTHNIQQYDKIKLKQ